MTWELTGVPYTSAREPGGIAEANEALRECGLAQRLAELGVEDGGNLALGAPSGERGDSGLLNEAALAELVRASRQRVDEVRRRGVSVVIYNPALDPDRTDARQLIDYLARLVAANP